MSGVAVMKSEVAVSRGDASWGRGDACCGNCMDVSCGQWEVSQESGSVGRGGEVSCDCSVWSGMMPCWRSVYTWRGGVCVCGLS